MIASENRCASFYRSGETAERFDGARSRRQGVNAGGKMGTAWLLHISDIHVGKRTSGGGLIWHTNGHDPKAVEAFADARDQIVNQCAGTKVLVVSGDVSARGGTPELDLYEVMRDTGFQLDPFLQCDAFADGFDHVLDIPGNHDYWNGKILNRQLHHPARHRYFPQCPTTINIPLDRYFVAIHGLCSTCGANSRQQFYAVGEYCDADLAKVQPAILHATTQAQSLRLKPCHLLVTHHSPSDGTVWTKGFSTRSRGLLEALCQVGPIEGLLTGHAHARNLDLTGQPDLPPEARCSTTLQANALFLRQQREFLLHRLSDDTGVLEWTVTPWVFDDHAAFHENHADAVEFLP